MRTADDIARACIATYDSLPRRGKPLVRSNGQPEWTVLAGFVLVGEEDESLNVISLGTGVKCLPANRLPLHGDVLHDSHAEVIARRGFLFWLFHELALARDTSSQYLQKSGDQAGLFELKPAFKLCVYVSTLPCGDASTLYLSKQQDPEVSASFGDNDTSVSSTALARGRQGYLHLGALRTKPARVDAVSTESLSCSDKLASWSYLGVQGALLSRLLKPIYVSTYVFGGIQAKLQPEMLAECRRALYGRLEKLSSSGMFNLTEPAISFTSAPFVPSKEDVAVNHGSQPVSGAESLSYIADHGTEVLLNGVKQGNSVTKAGQQKPKARSRLCRRALLLLWEQLQGEQSGQTLLSHKQASIEYQVAKAALRNKDDSPFKAWLVSDRDLQVIDSEGERAVELD